MALGGNRASPYEVLNRNFIESFLNFRKPDIHLLIQKQAPIFHKITPTFINNPVLISNDEIR